MCLVINPTKMSNKRYLGKVISFKISGWKDLVTGILLDYNDDWTLIKSRVDYVVDGFIIIKNKVIIEYYRGENEKFADRVFALKQVNGSEKPQIPLTDVYSILTAISSIYGVFGLHRKWENELYIGKTLSIDNNVITYDFLDSKAKWLGKTPVKASEIRMIEFDTDYINSLKLVAEAAKKKRTAK